MLNWSLLNASALGASIYDLSFIHLTFVAWGKLYGPRCIILSNHSSLSEPTITIILVCIWIIILADKTRGFALCCLVL